MNDLTPDEEFQLAEMQYEECDKKADALEAQARKWRKQAQVWRKKADELLQLSLTDRAEIDWIYSEGGDLTGNYTCEKAGVPREELMRYQLRVFERGGDGWHWQAVRGTLRGMEYREVACNVNPHDKRTEAIRECLTWFYTFVIPERLTHPMQVITEKDQP